MRDVVRRTRTFVARRYTSPTKPTTQTAPATAPAIAENQRYGALGHADRLGEGLRDHQPDDVAADRGERAVVERRAGPAEDLVLEQLRRAAGPAELVGAVAPPRADDERRDRGVRQDDPEQDLAGAHARAPVGIASGGPYGSRPTASSGGPSRASRATSRALGDGQRRQAGGDRVEHVRVRALEVVQGEPQQLDRRPVLGQQRLAVARRRERGEREHDRAGGRAARRESIGSPAAR